MKQYCASAAVLLLAASISLRADSINFSTFVSSSSIAAVEGGNNSTIAFNYAGNKFVGSVYLGVDNNQLYSTNLTGGVSCGLVRPSRAPWLRS